MTDLEKEARERCAEHEGRRLTAYRDSRGILTIGVGHLVTERDKNLLPRYKDHAGHWTYRISDGQADELFAQDWAKATAGATNLCRQIGIDPDEEEMAAHDVRRWWVLVEMCFQLGEGGLMKFRRMWRALERGDYAEAALEALDSRWMEQTPGRARRLAMILWRGVPDGR